MADVDENLRQHRQLHVHALKNAHEFGQHVRHEKEHDADSNHGDKRRIHQGGGKFRLDLGKPLKMIRHASQHLDQRAAGFASAHHIHVKIGENPGLFRHWIRQTASLHDVLLELFADIGRDAFGFEMGHAVERDGQRHAWIEEVGQLLGESGQFLELGLALLREGDTQGGRKQRLPFDFTAGTSLGGQRHDAGFGCVHSHREEAQAFNLDQRRRTIGNLEHALDDFTGPAPGLVRELWHKPGLLSNWTRNLPESCGIPSGNFLEIRDRSTLPPKSETRNPKVEIPQSGTKTEIRGTAFFAV